MKLTNETLTQKLDELKKNKDGVSSKIMEKGQNIRLINVEYEKIIKEQKNLTDTLKDNKNKLSIHKKKLGGEILKKLEHLEFDLENKRFHKHELERKLDDLRKIISLDDEQVNKIYTENEKKKTTLMGIIDFKTNEINSATIEINGNFFSPDSAEKIAVKYVDYVDAGIKYTKGMAEKQRQEAATRFNNTIKTLMNELNFTEFKDLRLNKDFRLYIERVDSDTQEYVSQLASTLCTSEKLTIALMLQIALKETYLPHIPFLIIDDIMEDFDEERRQKIYKYLYSKAEEQDWIIIVTKLVENQEPLKVVKLSLK
jgi:DNA repair exonuclease SbcCD ATPase subunit